MDIIKCMMSYSNTSSDPDNDKNLSIINPLSPHVLTTSELINYRDLNRVFQETMILLYLNK